MFNEREKVVFRVLYFPFLTSSTKVSFGSQFDANANAYDANDNDQVVNIFITKVGCYNLQREFATCI